jgi:branched-chain amino acid transport system ATP-binding protein
VTYPGGPPATAPGTTLAMHAVQAGYFEHDLVLREVSLEARPGHVTAILGPNGSGKSTTLRVLYGFLQPRSGSVTLGDDDISSVGPDERLARGIALLPQGHSIFPQLSVHENLELGAWLLRRDRARLDAVLDRTYEQYPMLKQMRRRPAGSLSGGQQRMLEFARTLVLDPAIVLIDEPSVGLAPALVDEVYAHIARLKEEGRTIVLVDQNVEAAVALADYVYTLAYGRNDVDGSREDFEGRLGDVIRGWLAL